MFYKTNSNEVTNNSFKVRKPKFCILFTLGVVVIVVFVEVEKGEYKEE